MRHLFQFVVSCIYLSQGTAAMHLRCDGVLNDCFISCLLLSLMVK